MNLKEKLIGSRQFYKRVLMISVPIMIQNGITHFVGMLDNIMVGKIGTEQMSSVAIINQLLFVYNLCIFGAVSGAGIFTAQYFGRRDDEGVRNTFRFKMWIGTLLTVASILVFVNLGSELISLYLNGEGDVGDLVATLNYGLDYLKIIIWGLPAFMVVQTYASTMRECGETVMPMIAGVIAVFVNLVFNYLLIFGKFGCPMLGVEGAAIATVISRYAELFAVVLWSHFRKNKHTYMVGMYKTMKVPKELVARIIAKGMPLMLNEALWGTATATLMQCYSVRGLSVVAGINICNTLGNVFNVVFIAMGESVAIIIGQLLGAGRMKEAKDTDRKLIAFSVFCCVFVAVAMFAVAPFFPELYNTDKETKKLAMWFIMAAAIFMPQNAFLHASYFTLRSGGKTIITFIFDSGFIWFVSVPVAFILSRYTDIHVVMVYCFVYIADWIKCVLGYILVKKGIWLNNIVGTNGEMS